MIKVVGVKEKLEVLLLLSPRYEMSYRLIDAFLAQPGVRERYVFRNVHYSPFDEALPDLSGYSPDAVVTSMAPGLYDEQALMDVGVPVVNLSSGEIEGMMSLYVDEVSLVKQIVGHCKSAGYEELVFVGTVGMRGALAGQRAEMEKRCVEEEVGFQYLEATEKAAGVIP